MGLAGILAGLLLLILIIIICCATASSGKLTRFVVTKYCLE